MTKQSQGHSNYLGASWVRVDFHLHSPGAFSFKFPDGVNLNRDQDRIVNQFVQQLVDHDIRVAAITDYQGIRAEWFTRIQNAAQMLGIVVFPGAELSFKQGKYGLHLIAIFPLNTTLDSINLAIQMLDVKAHEPLIHSDGNHRDIDLAKNIKDSLLSFRDSTHALLIPAHPSNDNGLFKSCSPRDAAEIIQAIRFDAIECFGPSERHMLVSTGILNQEFVDRIASVEVSDCHALDEIGTKDRQDGTPRATYLKLSVQDDLLSIRLALHDPQVLVKTGEKPDMKYTHFERLEVDGSGFLSGLSLIFSPELNVLIGGRGVGKSAILETIRYILDLPLYSSTEYREGLVQFALGSGGKALLYVAQLVNPNIYRRYRIERVWGEEPRVFDLNLDQEVLLKPVEILGDQETPLYFGQREIYEVTRNDPQRLRLLDEIIGRQARTQLQQVQKLEGRLRENARDILEKRRKLADREEIEHRLEEINHKINLYRSLGLASKLHKAMTLAADEQRLTRAKGSVTDAHQDWQEAREYWVGRWNSLREELREAESDQKHFLSEADSVLADLQSKMEEIFHTGEICLHETEQKLQDILKYWEEARKPVDEEIRRIKQELGEQSLDPDELIKLTEEQTRLEPQLRTLKKIQTEADNLIGERRKLLGNLRDARREVWRLRNKQAEVINGKLRDRVKIQIEDRGQREQFIEQLVSFFRGSRVDKRSFEQIVSGTDVIDGIQIVQRVQDGVGTLETDFHLTSIKASQIHSYLTEDEGRLFDLELLSPEDKVDVFLKIEDKYRPIERLSIGQRATALLLLLLVQDERLLIVDQPEDDLDNRFIYEDIVRILREQKGKRQLVTATHNPNVPVLGNAELIVALEAQEEHCTIAAEGAIDRRSIQEFVRNVMEGGEEAFLRRAQKYGWG
jgi:chromosome segregation protein